AHRNQRANRERNADRVIRAGDADVFASLIEQANLRTHHDLAAARLGRDHHQRGQARDLVELLDNRNAFLDVLEAHRTGVLGHDGTCQRIPGCQTRTGLDVIVVAHGNRGAIRYLVAFALAAVVVENNDLARTGNRHALTLGVGDIAQANGKSHRTGRLGFHRAGHGRTRCRATDVESTHRQLCTRLTNGLGSDDTHRFTTV